MITPLIFTDLNINSVRYKKNGYQSVPDKINIELSGYETGQAILARNNITFKNLATPIEVTDRYNKKTFGKDHLDLPNIHVYEYPDTNLQVFIDENENMQNNTTLEARFYIKHQNNTGVSILKNELCKRMIANCLQKQIPNAKLHNNIYGFYTISTKTNNIETEQLKKLNVIILNPQFDSNDLEIEKQQMIEELKDTDYTKNNLYILSDKNSLKSIEECINEINEISVDKLKKYYKNIIDNSGAGYYITLNKNIMNDKDKSNLLRDLNTNITTKFKKVDLNTNKNSFVSNDKSVIFIKDSSIDGIEFDYPYESKSLRDEYIALFASLILLFLSEPFIEENSDGHSETLFLSKKSDLSSKYYNLKFYMPKPEFTKLSPERALHIQKEIAKMVNDTDYTVTLEDIKKTYKEIFDEDIRKSYQPDKNNNNLYQYGCNIFQLYEIIDSINTQDIKEYIDKYIIQQEPIVRYKDKEII